MKDFKDHVIILTANLEQKFLGTFVIFLNTGLPHYILQTNLPLWESLTPSISGVDPDSFVMGSECRRHEISRGVRGHAPPENFEI